MALNEQQHREIERGMERFLARRRPKPEIRDEVDIGYRVRGQSVEIFEIRPEWRRPERKLELKVAKATYVTSRGVWKILWAQRDLKWHGYDPLPEVDLFREFLEAVDEDRYGCFWG